MPTLLIGLLSNILPSLLDRLLPEDPSKAAEAKLKFLEMAQKGELAQLDAQTQLALGQLKVNEEEAKSDGVFKGGWRPAIGWTCAGGLFYQLLARPVLGWAAQNLWGWSLPPSLEMDTLGTIVFGMLGLGAYRTFEKVKGVQ